MPSYSHPVLVTIVNIIVTAHSNNNNSLNNNHNLFDRIEVAVSRRPPHVLPLDPRPRDPFSMTSLHHQMTI